MTIGDRNIKKVIKALFQKQHYIAFFNMLLIYPNFIDSFKRYFLNKGIYPCKINIRTPLGKINPIIYSYYDILTVNEIFCRKDYKANKDIKVVVDIGSNIGLSALYFLTKNKYVKCYLYEPVPMNVKRLIKNLGNFIERYKLYDIAVYNETGIKKFGIEQTGRYCGLHRNTDSYIDVKCVHINDVLKDVLNKEKKIDILKIDIEGDEINVIKSIQKEFLYKINNIFLEIDPKIKLDKNFFLFSDLFQQKRYSNIYKLKYIKKNE